MARIEADISRLREIIDPLPGTLQDVIQRSAIANERIATHLEESRRVWERLENDERLLIQLKEQQTATCEFCGNVRKVFWWALGLGCTISGYFILNWFESHKNAKVIGVYLRNLVDLLT